MMRQTVLLFIKIIVNTFYFHKQKIDKATVYTYSVIHVYLSPETLRKESTLIFNIITVLYIILLFINKKKNNIIY